MLLKLTNIYYIVKLFYAFWLDTTNVMTVGVLLEQIMDYFSVAKCMVIVALLII